MSPACSLNCLLSHSDARHGASQIFPQLLQMCAGSEDSSSLWLRASVSHHFLSGKKIISAACLFHVFTLSDCSVKGASQCAVLSLGFAWASSFREKFLVIKKLGYEWDMNVSFLVKVNSLPVLNHSSVHIFHLTVFLYIFCARYPFILSCVVKPMCCDIL